eukprot:1143575-Pelagomonas_calceolata.AAC.6
MHAPMKAWAGMSLLEGVLLQTTTSCLPISLGKRPLPMACRCGRNAPQECSDSSQSCDDDGCGGGDDDDDDDVVCMNSQENRMKKAVQVMADTMNTLRTGRANPAILDRISVRRAFYPF